MITINEHRKHKLKASDRKYITNLLQDLTTPSNRTRFFNKVPIDDIKNILAKRNLIINDSEWRIKNLVREKNGRVPFDIAYNVPDEEGEFSSIINAQLMLSWEETDSGNLMVNAYIS